MKRALYTQPAMSGPLVAALTAFSLLTGSAAAQVAPSAGSILQQIQPAKPSVPLSGNTGLTIEKEGGSHLPPSAPFMVKTLRISGNAQFDTATLHALVADAEGKNFTLSQLGELVARITDYYHHHGYPLARALIPAQTIRSGVVDVEVIEAHYGKVSLANHSRVNDALLQDMLSDLQSGQIIAQSRLDRTLLLLFDVPGAGISATLAPGDVVGTSDLLVEASAGPFVSGSTLVDNYGNRATGRVRVGAAVSINNLLHHGDVLNASGLSSASGLHYERITYESLLSRQGTRMGGAYSMLHYALDVPSLDAHGTAQVASLWLKQPIVRSRNVNLYGQIQYDRLQLRDHVYADTIQQDRHVDNWTVNLAGDARDVFASGGIYTWNLGWTAGRVDFDDAAAQQADAASAKTHSGEYLVDFFFMAPFSQMSEPPRFPGRFKTVLR